MTKQAKNRISAFARAAGLCAAASALAGCDMPPTNGVKTPEAVIYPLNCVVVDVNAGDFYSRAIYDFNRGVARFEPFVHSTGGKVLQDPFDVTIADIPDGWGRERARQMFELIPRPNNCAVPKFRS